MSDYPRTGRGKPSPEALKLRALVQRPVDLSGPRTMERLRTIIIEAETLSTVMRSPGNLLTTDQRRRASELLAELASYGRLAFSKGRVRKTLENA